MNKEEEEEEEQEIEKGRRQCTTTIKYEKVTKRINRKIFYATKLSIMQNLETTKIAHLDLLKWQRGQLTSPQNR